MDDGARGEQARKNLKIALVRLDKIGDLVSTLPVDGIPSLQNAEISWVIARGLGFVAAQAVPPRTVLELDKTDARTSFRLFRSWLRQNRFDVVVSFQAPWWVSLAMWLEGVPVRAGVLSQWHSFLFFNRGLRQRRSLAEKHEADYNRDLLAHALELAKPWPETPVLRMQAAGTDVRQRLRLADRYVVLHPGMAGSARNWSQKNYVSLIREFSKRVPVMITGTAADEPWLDEIRAGTADVRNLRWLVGEVSSRELLDVLAGARGVIAPSTGVAHLAAALGRPLISLFSPVRVQTATRWRPRGPQVDVLAPAVECPAIHRCLGEACPHFDCMDRIKIEDILARAEPWL